MEESQSGAERGGGEESSPLSVVFPGEGVQLSTGDVVFVKPWGVRALVREIPAKFGSFVGKLAPISESLRGSSPQEAVPIIMQEAAGDMLELVAWTAGMSVERLEELPAEDFLRLARAIMRQNAGFFEQLAGLLGDATRELGLRGSRSSPA